MKNSNLLNRLLSYSHEKQKPQRFARYAAMLIMLLTLGVGQMWGASGTIYVTPANMWGGSWDYSTSKLKIGYNYNSNNGDQWTGEQDMTLTEYTFHNYPVYSYTVSSSTDWAKIYVYHYKGNTKQATYNVGGDNWIDFSSYIDKVYNGWHNSAHEKLALSDMDANTEVTVYYAYNNSSSYTIKANMRISNDYGVWRTYTMTSTGHMIGNKTIYKCTFNDFREHLYVLQFQHHNAGGYVSQDQPINNSWTAMSTYGSKMYNGSSWVAYQYDVALDQQDGSGGTTSITATCGSAMPGSKTAPSRTGYTFGGYYTEEDGGGTQYYTSAMASARNWPSDGTGPNTLYAKWTANQTTVTLYANEPAGQTVTGGGTQVTATYDAALPSFSALTCNGGYALTGYWTTASGEGTKVINANGTFAANSGIWNRTDGATLTLYARWSLDRTLTYDDNGSTGGSVPASPTVYANGASVTVLGNTNSLVKTGYTFTGWNTAPGGGGTSYSAGSSITMNNNYTLYAQWSENMTAVTISASPAGTGTFTVNSVSGTSASVGVTTTATVVATAATDFQFVSWATTNCSASPTNTASTTLTGNGSSATGTLTATFTENVASGWYLGGSSPFYSGDDKTSWETSNKGYQMTKKYRGMDGVFYRSGAVTTGGYYTIHNGTTRYRPSTGENATFSGAGYANKISMSNTSASANFRFGSNGTYYIIADTRGATPVIWYETTEPDRFNYHSVNVTGVENAKGTCKVTLGSTSGFETTRFANGETFYVTITGVSGYIPTITIGGTPTTWWKEQDTYTASGTMSTSDIAVTISYTTTRAVRFAKTTGCETLTATGPSSTSVSDNTKIKDGTEITFHQENSTGYTFSKWYSNNTGTSGTEYSDDDDDYTLTVSSSAYTIYPLYTEDMHTVTLNSSVSGGHVEIGGETVTSTSAGIATASPTITAVADSGYYFTGWTGNIGSGVTIASGSTSTASITIRATADSKSITANFAKRWVLAGEWLKVGENWDVTTNVMSVGKISNTTFVSKQITGLAANTEYKFKLYDNTSGDHWVGYATSGQVYAYPNEHDSIVVNTYGASGHDITLKTAAQGDYYFYYNLKNHKLNISFPASRKVEMGIYTQSDGVSSAYVGGTISAVDERDNVITNGLYIKSGDDITFTASPKAGYIWRGWYDNAYGYGDPVATERVHTDENVTSVAFRRYAFFEEALYTVKVNRNDVIETSYKVGIDTHPTIMAATAPTGKVFDRWVTTGSATVADPYSSTTTITGATDDVSTVTATFKDLPKIYIDMTAATGWSPSNMYVVFYKNGGYFDSNNGTGLSSTYVINALPLEMTQIEDTKIWYYAYDPTSGDFAGQTITCVTFIDHTYSANYGNFTSATAVYRTDFSSCMNMFVLTDNTGVNKNTTCHYRNTNAISGHDTKGYWRKYEEKNSGFYLNNLPGGSVEFTNEDGGNSYTAVANLDANTNYYFYLGGCNGWNWSNKDDAFNSNNRTRELVPYGDVSSDGLRCHLTTTAAGYYTFTLTPLNTGRKVQVSVAFPVAANDYRAVYHEKETSPTISRPSNIIKNDQNSGTISLWLNKGTNYISFQKAAVAAGGAVSWSACGSQQTVSDVPEAGIYNMTLTRDGSTYTVSTPEKYEGGLYIRTDCAPGKWADYTENRLDENTFNFKADDASTYDYYYCKWINDAGTNVRCVIANDYNVAISDTLKTEAILGGGETLPEGANVRFSYNSVTNELKRSYLTGASTDVFLNIMPDAASKVYKTDGTTDMYNGGAVGARNKFSDLGNWVYEMDVKVYPGATASVQANYNSTQQPLIAAGTTLLGGTKEELYQIRLIYDFRTNYLMSAWMPSGTVDEAIALNSDMMIVRRAQNQANKLSFDEGGKLDKVKRAYGVFEFNKSEMVSNMNSWSDGGYTYGLCMYYFSLPFDVNVADIFGVGTMGDDWRIQFYNGTKRAAKGWFAGDGTTTFWEDVPADTVLHAYEGYCLMLNRSHFNNGSHAVWTNVTTNAYLYFPSVAPVAALKDNEMEITVPSHECKIDRFFDQDKAEYYDPSTKTWKKGARNHKYVDSHWNLMGTPLFEDATADALTACKVTIGDADSTLNYIYEWVPSTNSLSARQVLNTDFTFKPMYAYMVQYAGKVTFTGASITPASIAARRTSENKQYTIDLLLTKEDQFAGRTYVELRENAVDSFMLNEDMYMMKGSKIGDIYTHADGYELAANVLSVNSHIVPVSIDAKAAGTYTISMPSNFSGTVTLIDKYAQTRTNLAFEDYEIYLEKGTISDRFELEININKTPTAIDGVGADNSSLKDGNAHKFIMNDMLYILKDGVLYDARGNRVK